MYRGESGKGKTVLWSIVFVTAIMATGQRVPAQSPDQGKQQAVLENGIRALLNAASHHQSPSLAKAADFVIAIVHDEDVPAKTVEAAKAAFDKHRSIKVAGKNVNTVDLPFHDPAELKKSLISAGATAVYITDGTDTNARNALKAAHDLKILSITTVPDYVTRLGVSLGVDCARGKTEVLINLAGSRIEGVRFDERLLRISKVYF